MEIELLGENKNILKCLDDPLYRPDPRGLGVLFAEKMRQNSSKIAEIESESGKQSTYGEVLLRSTRVAQHLLAKDIKQDDIIILCCRNNMSSSHILYAGLFLGVRTAFIDPSLPKYDMEYLLKLTRPRILFTDSSSSETLSESIKSLELDTEIVDFNENKKFTPYSYFSQSTGSEMEFQIQPIKTEDDVAFIYFSSGTTGLPKGICATHYALQNLQRSLSQGCDTKVSLGFSTFYWISASIILINCVVNGGTRIVATEGFQVETAMHIISKYKVTYAILAQYYTSLMVQRYKSNDFNTPHLSTLHIIGERLSDEQMIKAKELFPHTAVSSGYGMTEANGFVCVFHTNRDKLFIESKLGSCGRPIQGLTYKIVDIDTEEILGVNQQGELRIKGKMMRGYLNNPEATKNAYDNDGFFKTGDLAYYDKDYCFYIVGRVKEIIKYRGFIESSTAMESILLSHPEIKEAAVVGKPDPVDGDHACAFIVLHKESQLTKEKILEFYNEKILHHEAKKLRGGIFLENSIPRTPTGKPKKMLLKDYLKKSA